MPARPQGSRVRTGRDHKSGDVTEVSDTIVTSPLGKELGGRPLGREGVGRPPEVHVVVAARHYSPGLTSVSGSESGATLYVAVRSSSITPDQLRPKQKS